MTFINKAALLSPPALARHTVAIPAIEGEVVFRELTVSERLARKKLFKPADADDERATTVALLCLVASSLCNEDGSEMFPESEWQEAAEAIMARSSAASEQLVTEWQKVQGLVSDEDKVKNSDASQSDSSSSGSRKTSAIPRSKR